MSGADFLKWRTLLEKSGEWSDQRRTLLRDMERYASGVGCRHRHLLAHFGERYTKDDCGACDYCLGELESVADPVTLARKILSCVARVGQRFGAGHVTNVLRGATGESVTSRGHDTLSVFGLLNDQSVDDVRGYIDQLLGRGLLQQTGDQYPVLALTDDGVALLKDAGAAPGLTRARQRYSPRSLNTRTMAPSAMPRGCASSAWISSSGSPSASRRLCTLTKVELRKLRAGGEIMASGWRGSLPSGSLLGR